MDQIMAESGQRIRVFCVDDHRVMLEGLALLIGRQADMEVVGSATNGEQAIDLVARMKPDVTRGQRKVDRLEVYGPEGFLIGFDQSK